MAKAAAAKKPASKSLAVVEPAPAPAVPVETESEEGMDLVPEGDSFGQYGAPQSVAAIAAILAEQGIETEHVGGSLPPAFSKKPREGSCRIFIPIAIERTTHKPKETDNFDLLVMDIIDPQTRKLAYRAQHASTKAIEDFFGSVENGPKETYSFQDKTGKKQTRPIVWGESVFALTYAGQLDPKENGQSGMKMWRIDALKGFEVVG